MIVVDSEAFVRGDWSMIENDFDAANFEGIRANHSMNPDDWRIVFSRLDEYRDGWLASSREFLKHRFVRHTPLEAVLARCRIDAIDIAGDRALAHKKFSGEIELADGKTLAGNRQTIYRLHKLAGVWKIVGFIGQLPLLDEP